LPLSFPPPLSSFPCPPPSYLALPLPVSTLRAVARSGGWGCCGGWRRCGGCGRLVLVPLVLLASSSPCPPSSPPVVLLVSLSPRPPSSGGGGGTPVPLSRRRRPSTRDPPHEQLLVRLGAGGGLASSSPRPGSSGGGGGTPVPPQSSPSFHPRSTPRAVAREAGGEWWVVRRGAMSLSLSWPSWPSSSSSCAPPPCSSS
jgi:hypothetical protein